MAEAQNKLPSPETFLLDYIRQLERHREDTAAVHVQISKLQAFNRREHHIRTATNTFEELVPKTKGYVFSLSNKDLVFIFDARTKDEIDSAIFKLKFLYNDDPLINGETEYNFVDYYDIEKDYDNFLRMAQVAVHESATLKPTSKAAQRHNDDPHQDEQGMPLTPKALGRIEEALKRADLSNMMRRQAICAVIGDAQPQPMFHELFISIKDLQQTLLPNWNVTHNRWLFQHLTEILDRRMLSLLNRADDASVSGSVSINLNVSTLLSPDFMSFDDNVKAGQRGTIVLELQKVDIFADLGAFSFARDFARERGYRICIDGLNRHTLPFINRAKLGADMVKLIWLPDMDTLDDERQEEIRRGIANAGETRVTLCRCDDEKAIRWGRSIGITMFQGRYVENLLTERTQGKSRARAQARH